LCEDFVAIAQKRNVPNVSFAVGDATQLAFDDASFPLVFTERCLINLDSWEKQQKALNEIRRVLTPGGIYVMIEAFTDGLAHLNEARDALGLAPIPQPAHDVYFDKQRFLSFVEDTFEQVSLSSLGGIAEQGEQFLSSYYFGSRVLYPALIAGKKELLYNNKFVEFFSYMPGYGTYSPVQLFILKKK